MAAGPEAGDFRARLSADPAMTDWCRGAGRELGLPDLAERVWVGWNPRLRTTAGRAWWPIGVIELNPKLRTQGEDEVRRTLRHELAHLVAYERAGGKRIDAHGPEWRAACADLGIPGERVSHSLPFGGTRQKKRFRYTCRHCGSSIMRVRRIRGASACHICCRRHAGGVFDRRFLLVESRL